MITLLNKFDDNYSLEKKDVLEITNAYIKENNLELYLVDVIFDDKSQYIGAYNMKDKVITLNNDKMVKFCHKSANNLSRIYNIDENYYTYFFNYYYLYIIFHELEHVMQTKKYEGKESLLYKFLYELCQRLHYSSQVFYHDNHDLFPMEIDANNNGYIRAYNLLSYTKLPGRELKIMHGQYYFSLLYNYAKINNFRILTPIDKLCNTNEIINKKLILQLLDICKLSKIERLNLGLDITSSEYNSIEREKIKLLLLKR